MIESLRQFARNEGLLKFLDGLLGRSILREQAHGVALAFDALWLEWAHLQMYLISFPLGYLWGLGVSNLRSLTLMNPDSVEKHWALLLSERRPPNWQEHCKMQGYPENAAPILIKIIVQDPEFNPRKQELPRGFEAHPIVYEHRPPCVAVATANAPSALRPGASVGRQNPMAIGTLGGFVKNATNNLLYAVSCAHVLGPTGTRVVHPGPSKGRQSPEIGTVELDIIPARLIGSQVCNNRSSFAGNSLDLAVASIDPTAATPLPSLGYPSSVQWIRQMSTGDFVSFHGQASGTVDAKVDDLNIWRSVLVNQQQHCFGDLFSIVPRQKAYLNTALAKPGDSGSWVILDDPRTSAWVGMVIADDGLKAYCCFAEHICNRTSSHFGSTGSCILP